MRRGARADLESPLLLATIDLLRMRRDPGEVDEIFEVPLHFLMNPAHHRRHTVDWQGGRREWFSMPYQDEQTTRMIWGVTAGILRNFYQFLQAKP